MSLISAIQAFVKTYSGLTSGALVAVNYLDATPTAYSIEPLPGVRKLEEYIDGSSLRDYPFVVRFVKSTLDDATRVANAAWAEAFADWLEAQTLAGTFPTLGTGKTPWKIEATNWGYLDQQGESGTADYLITCHLEYDQTA